MILYTRHQLLVLLVLLGAAGLGLAIGQWRRAHPDLVERLEQFDRQPPPSPAPAPPADPRGAARRPVQRQPQAPKLVDTAIDVNRASVLELTRLPGVGRTLAARIVEARDADGPFAAVDDLRRVRGLSRVKIERLRPLVRLAE